MPKKESHSNQELLTALQTLLLAGEAGTQEDLCERLSEQGLLINQSKLSRLLRKLNATKEKNEHGDIVYRLPREPAPPTPNSHLRELVMSVRANETTIVIQTNPGSASLIARLLDYNASEDGIMATLAGDDTVFVLPTSVKTIEQTLKKIRSTLGA